MDIATFHKSRRFADVKSGRIAYLDIGEGPAALFVHGVPLNGYHWRHVIEKVRHRRRCIAIDLMGLGYTEIAPNQDVSFAAQARMIAEVIDSLGIEKIDLVSNDSGGAIAQIFAAHHPDRLTSLVLTNCDVHDGWPPPQVLPVIERARNGTLAPIFQPLVDRPDLVRERFAKGESVPFFRCYADPGNSYRRAHPPVLAAAAFLAAAHRGLPALLACLRQYPDHGHSRRAETPDRTDADRVGA
jgi:pimeloyl-ACP methyl ester carboxylesterase